MTKYPQSTEINNLLKTAKKILIMQADNPDGDSLGSAIALEYILSDLGIEPILYCGVNIPTYLRYIDGWDRVQSEVPNNFDLSIMLDVSVDSLFDALNKSRYKGVVKSKPCIIIDHHNVEVTIDYASVVCSQPAVATAEVLFELSEQLGWKIDIPSIKALLCGILSDSLGLTSEGTTARSVEIVAELVKRGGSIAELENKRRNLMKKSPELVHYKGKLLQRVEYYHENQIAVISIPWEEIEKYSHEYNPSVLVIDDVRQTTNTAVVIAFKSYPDGKITAKIRCNYGFGIANELAKKFGGGGHPYASGFKIDHGSSLDKIIKDCIDHANTLLEGLEQNENL